MIVQNTNPSKTTNPDAHQESFSKKQNLTNRQCQAVEALHFLQGFMGRSQVLAMVEGMRGEEREFFYGKAIEMVERIRSMPVTYQQDGLGDSAVAHLHYFVGGFDWYITERDVEQEQLQAFGLCCLHESEIGYVSIAELIQNGVELDLHFTPTTLAEIRRR